MIHSHDTSTACIQCAQPYSHLGNIKKYVSQYLFRVWYMQSEAFRFEKAFEHIPKPSKHQINIVFNDFHIKQMSYSRTCRKQFWPVLQYVTKCAEFNGDACFAWNLLTWWVFEDLHFGNFWILYFLYFGGRRHEAVAFHFVA